MFNEKKLQKWLKYMAERPGHQPTTLKTSRLGSESSNARRTWSGD